VTGCITAVRETKEVTGCITAVRETKEADKVRINAILRFIREAIFAVGKQ